LTRRSTLRSRAFVKPHPLSTIPGIISAGIVIGEIGLDMSRFPTAGHLISWAGLCPRNDESAGKRPIDAHA
jgi:transposase